MYVVYFARGSLKGDQFVQAKKEISFSEHPFHAYLSFDKFTIDAVHQFTKGIFAQTTMNKVHECTCVKQAHNHSLASMISHQKIKKIKNCINKLKQMQCNLGVINLKIC